MAEWLKCPTHNWRIRRFNSYWMHANGPSNKSIGIGSVSMESHHPYITNWCVIVVQICGNNGCFQEEKIALLGADLNLSMFQPLKELKSLNLSFNCFSGLILTEVIVVQICGNNGCFQEEKIALLEYKEFIKFHNYSIQSFLSSWVNDPSSDCCTWKRVTCNSSTGHVIHLSLDGSRQEWARCYFAASLDLNLSMFQPLKELKSLNLSFNCFSGLILTEDDHRSVSTLKMLKTLDLSFNFFNLSIIRPLKSLTSLKNLILRRNFIEGDFPVQELSILQNLEMLDVSWNGLGSPSTVKDFDALSRLKKLKTLDLSYNNFDGKIFEYLYALPTLSSLFLDANDINGALDGQGLCNMKTLQDLDLSGNGVNGTLGTCLNNLTSLQTLDLSYNYLSGSIPLPLLTNLTSLEYLSLWNNSFEGSFSLSILANHSKLKVLILGPKQSKMFQVDTENPPYWIPSFQLKVLKMPNCQVNSPTRTMPSFLLYQHGLEYIELSQNNLVGMFPNWLLVNNPKLQHFFLNDNSFIGSFQLLDGLNQQMDQLLEFDISSNEIQGLIPENIGFIFPNLDTLNVSSNKFDGDIAASIGDMSKLSVLDLANNNFSGKIPNQILLGCISLQFLRVSHNSLRGEIFARSPNWKYLSVLMMDHNEFNGTLKNGMVMSSSVIELDISNNNLTGRLPAGWINKYGYFSVSRNNFEGEILKELCKVDLNFINLSYNRFSGAIPSCFNSSSLYSIHLQGNSLTGTIPRELSGCNELVTMDMRDNKLSGNIPKGIYRLQHLKFLLLGGNALQGQLPSELCKLKRLNFLDLSRNNFTGSIPSCFNNISFSKDIDASIYGLASVSSFSGYLYGQHFEVQYDGSDPFSLFEEEVQLTVKSLALPYNGGMLNYISGLDLSLNQLSGEIPSQLGELSALHALNLSHNSLRGSIPESFQNLKLVEGLDLSYNNLSGNIPSQLQVLNFLEIFNVSYNNLSGAVPNQKQFGTFDESSYEGNPYLDFPSRDKGIAALPTPPSHSNGKGKNESAIDFTAFSWTFAASFVMVQLTMVVVLQINPHWRRIWFYFIETCLYKCCGRFLPYAFY
ncbi:hypothetical protein L6164_037477 [Bauhinia variegata]|uniref:Uncharacterized protein n=1 Tax=Bauhinia variegata TaxID=167791 RepID=A0ACB9KKA3_BAUVA|nr:hypothetical protein L6164_037477 [Bauhinia variegata]